MKHVVLVLAVAGVGLAFATYRPQAPSHEPHGEWVTYANPAGDSISAYIAFPERPDPAPAVIVIHEIFGMSDFAAAVADTLAMQGFVAIAPDLLSRQGGTEAMGEGARRAVSELAPADVNHDVDGAFAYLQSLRSVRDDAIGIIGFCWGGSVSFRYATHNPDLDAAVVCYGGAPDAAAMSAIRAAVLGVYAENDARINAGIPAADSAMRALGKEFGYTIYPGASHAFLRRGEPEAEVRRAWGDILGFLREQMER